MARKKKGNPIIGLGIIAVVLVGIVIIFLTYPTVDQTTLFVEFDRYNNKISNLRISDTKVGYLTSRESQQYNLEMASFNQFNIEFLDERERLINSTIIPLEQLKHGEYPIKLDGIPLETAYVRVSIIQGEKSLTTTRIWIPPSMVGQ